MNRFMLTMGLAAALAVGAGYHGTSVNAQEKKGSSNSPEVKTLDVGKLADAPKCCARARTVNFIKEFGVPLDYLGTIGVQIAEARKSADPVALAVAARGLEAAEAASGKKASVTSAEVMKEAVELAVMREIPAELKAIKALVSDDATRKTITQTLEVAEKAQADAKAASRDGDRQRAIIGTLEVRNYSNECLRIFVDGREVGVVHTGETGRLGVHSHRHHNTIEAFCLEGGELLHRTCFAGHTHYLVWEIK